MAVSGTSGALQINGIASGLDTDSIVESLLDIERIPLRAVDTKEAKANEQLTAWRSLNTRILAFETTITSLKDETMFNGRLAKSSDEAILKATASSGNDLGNYEITVNQLATRHQMISSNGYEYKDSSVGTGTVTIQVGAALFDPITIDSENNTLEGLRDAINNAKVGVSAAILDSGEAAGADRYKLIINSKNTGTSAEASVTFNLSGTAPSMVNLTDPQDAKITVGSGANAVEVVSNTNTVEDFLPGVSIELLKANPGETVSVSLEPSTTALKSQVNSFITNYNNMSKFFSDQFSYNKETEKSGTLFGDTSLLSFQNDLVSAATGAKRNGGDYAALSQVGISLDDLGNLSIKDTEAFEAALENPTELFKLLNDPDHGVLTHIQKTLDRATTSTTGLIASKETAIQGTLTDMKDKRLNILRYVDAQEVILRKQFTAMEQSLAMLQSQSQQLAAQIGGMILQQQS